MTRDFLGRLSSDLFTSGALRPRTSFGFISSMADDTDDRSTMILYRIWKFDMFVMRLCAVSFSRNIARHDSL